MTTVERLVDRFRSCEESCNHDLARGVSVRELLDRDGPHPAAQIVGFGSTRVIVLPDYPDAA